MKNFEDAFGEVTTAFEIGSTRGLALVTNQFVKDNNPYVPKDTGLLEKSIKNNTNYKSGEVVATTPYANDVYYNVDNVNFNLRKKPQARERFFEETWGENQETYADIIAKVISDEIN